MLPCVPPVFRLRASDKVTPVWYGLCHWPCSPPACSSRDPRSCPPLPPPPAPVSSLVHLKRAWLAPLSSKVNTAHEAGEPGHGDPGLGGLALGLKACCKRVVTKELQRDLEGASTGSRRDFALPPPLPPAPLFHLLPSLPRSAFRIPHYIDAATPAPVTPIPHFPISLLPPSRLSRPLRESLRPAGSLTQRPRGPQRDEERAEELGRRFMLTGPRQSGKKD